MKFRGEIRKLTALLICAAWLTGMFRSYSFASAFQADQLAAVPESQIFLFPGDSICGLDLPAYLNYNYDAPVELGENASWTNVSAEGLTNQAYEVIRVYDEMAPENSYYDIISAGYILTVTDGTSRPMYADGPGMEHQSISDDSADLMNYRTDKAWYPAGEAVMLEALPSQDGVQVFQNFEVDSANVEIQQDEATGMLYMIMPNQEVRLRAVYVDPLPEVPQDEAVNEGQPEGADGMNGPEDPNAYEQDMGEQAVQESVQPDGMDVTQGAEDWQVPQEGADWQVPQEGTDWQAPQEGENVQVPPEQVQVTVEDQGAVQMLTPEGEPTEEFTATDPFAEVAQIEQNGPDPNAPVGSIFDNVAEDAFEVTSADNYSDQTEPVPAPELLTEEPLTEEPETEKQTEAPVPVVEPAAVEQTEAPAPVVEPAAVEQTEAPVPATESAVVEQTEVPAPAAEPATEKQTEASAPAAEPATEKQTEASAPAAEPATEKQTEASVPAAEPVPVTYKVSFANPQDVTVTGADGTVYPAAEGVTAAAGTVLNLTANNSYADRRFSVWTASGQGPASTFASPTEVSTKLTVGAGDVTVTAGYIPISEVQVSSGSGSGTYAQGDHVSVTANKASTGWRFDHWEVLTGSAALEDPYSEKTGFVMPGSAVTLRAVYVMIEYALKVNNGLGGGAYTMDTEVSLEADWPAQGKEFDKWVIVSGNPDIAGTDRFYATLTMPASDVTVKATYKDGPNPAYNAIEGLENGAEYLKGTTLSFHAAGNGMGNTNPNPGDYRYKPTGYQIGNVSGGWQDSNFSTSMAINAVGDYTLTVTFTKEIFRDGTWVSDGTTDTKSVSFHVVNALSVQTGDTTPVAATIATAVVALAVICLILAVRRRRHRS